MGAHGARRAAIVAIAACLMLAGCAGGPPPLRVEIVLRYSKYEPNAVTVPAGRAVTFVLRNDDPIEHEWIVGDAALHERHRTGTEPHHGERPTEVSVAALTTIETTVTFDSAASLTYVCHLPGHEAYGMVGRLIVEAP